LSKCFKFATAFQTLNPNEPIRKVVALVLLLLFAFSITPRNYLHDIFANHKDVTYGASAYDDITVQKSGIDCGFHNLVAESPFADLSQKTDVAGPVRPAGCCNTHYLSFIQTIVSAVDNKGPPASAC
jgi:hypothetical protein